MRVNKRLVAAMWPMARSIAALVYGEAGFGNCGIERLLGVCGGLASCELIRV